MSIEEILNNTNMLAVAIDDIITKYEYEKLKCLFRKIKNIEFNIYGNFFIFRFKNDLIVTAFFDETTMIIENKKQDETEIAIRIERKYRLFHAIDINFCIEKIEELKNKQRKKMRG